VNVAVTAIIEILNEICFIIIRKIPLNSYKKIKSIVCRFWNLKIAILNRIFKFNGK